MKHTKKITSSILTCALLLSLCSCSNSGGEATPSSTTDDLQALDTVVDWDDMSNIDGVDSSNENGTGSLYQSGVKAGTVKALCYYDLATTQPALATLLAERFGGTIETELCSSGSAYFEKLGALVAAGDSPDIVRYDWMAYPWGVSKNMFTAMDEWLDIDSPVWSDEKDVIDSFTYAGKHYYFPSNVQTNFAILYNRLVLEEAGIQDPMELYKENNWTWDTFEELMTQWINQGEDYTGFTGGSWSSMMFVNTTGTKIIDVTGTEIINNMKNENVQRTMDWLSDLKKRGYIGEGFVAPGDAFIDGKLLFLGMGFTWGFEGSQETLFKMGVDCDMVALPFPRDPKADKYYMSADSFGFMVPAGAQNVQGAASWILCGRMYETDPVIVEQEREKKMSTEPVYYAKCPECKYNFAEHDNEALDTCPECGTPRKEKFKAYYSEEQMQVIDDMLNSDKFTFVFDNSVGFSDELSSIFTGDEESVYDGPIYYGSSYSQLRDANFDVVESYLEPFREALAEAQK